ncbi:hypothetical protein [Tsukamurella pseudospumae]|uniref:hypothetical protein n=1 Tax=Tsukamurella pseudospumae TaxID=239498 RepID=UPI000A9AC6FC|nr:hypothetical protein [Tsukamurella pseudospumae]
MTITRTITGATAVTALLLVFVLTGAPAWAYLLPALVLVVEVAMAALANRIDRATALA